MNLNSNKPSKPSHAGPRFRPKNPIMGPLKKPPPRKTTSTLSSDTKWGNKSAITVLNSSLMHTETVSFSENESRTIIAITEGRGEARCEIGIASIDTSHPTLVLCQMSDVQNYINTLTKINILNPTEIIVPATFLEASSNRLIDHIRKQFPNIKLVGVPRKSFNKSNGIDRITQLCLPSINTITVGLQHKYYALAATSALLTHLQNNLYIFYGNETLNITYEESEGYAIIDVSTADRLELVSSTKPAQAGRYSSLFGVLNRTYTRTGARALRSIILQPPFRLHLIKANQDSVTELIKRPNKLMQIQANLQKIVAIDQLLTISQISFGIGESCSTKQLNYILQLKGFIDLVEPLKEAVETLEGGFFRNLHTTLSAEHFAKIKELIGSWVHSSAYFAKGEMGAHERCFAIKAGMNGLLDLVRKTYSERVDDLRVYVSQLALKYDLPLTLGNNNAKGYHIVMKLNKQQMRTMSKSDIPQEFMQVYRLAGSFTMKTPELINLSTRIEDIFWEILKISNAMISKLICELKQYIGFFFKLCEEIGKLDMLQSLAEVSIQNKFVRPKFGEFTEMEEAYHPILMFLIEETLISNTISICNDFNVQIITGPNGSGKSIYIRQAVLLQVLAQIGCYIPAKSAIIRPMERIFARIYLEDNMEYGASAFMLEISEVKYMMTFPSENSLFIIDEPCRSTSVDEGTALAMAIIERFCQTKTFVYITTHYTKLTRLHDMYLNVKVWQMETIANGDRPRDLSLNFHHRLVPGVTQLKHYGVYIVRNIWPDDLCNDVYEILNEIQSSSQKSRAQLAFDQKCRLKYKLEADMRKFKSRKRLTKTVINTLLNDYCNELKKFDVLILNDSLVFDEPKSVGTHFMLGNGKNSTVDSSEDRITNFLNESIHNIDKLVPEVSITSLDGAIPQIEPHWDDLPLDEDELASIMDEAEASYQTEFTFTQESAMLPENPVYLTPIVHVVEGPNNPTPSPPKHDETSAEMSEMQTISSPSTELAKRYENEMPSTSTNTKPFRFHKKAPRFVPPRKLTRREIEMEFNEQTKRIYENSMANSDADNLSKCVSQILKRPSVKQVQNSLHMAFGRRTVAGGVEAIPTRPEVKKSRFKRKLSSNSLSNVDMTIFSDENARDFELFVQSDERDYKRFMTSREVEAKPRFKFNPDFNSLGNQANIFGNNCIDNRSNFVGLETPKQYNQAEIEAVMAKYENISTFFPETSAFTVFETDEEINEVVTSI